MFKKKLLAAGMTLSMLAGLAVVPAQAAAPTVWFYDDFSNVTDTFDAASEKQLNGANAPLAGYTGRSDTVDIMSRADLPSAIEADGAGVLQIAPVQTSDQQAGIDVKYHSWNYASKQPFSFTKTGDKLALEVKFKSSKASGHRFFSFRDHVDGRGDIATAYLMETDSSGNFVFKEEQGDVVLGQYMPNTWTHLMLLFEVVDGGKKDVSVDVYIDGEKRNDTPLKLNTGGCTGWNVFIRSTFRMAAPDKAYMDDFIVRSFGDLVLDRASVANGDQNVSAATEHMLLDFSMLLDAASLADIKVFAGNTELAQGTDYTASLAAGDKTRMQLSFEELAADTDYRVEFGGLRDILGNSCTSAYRFRTVNPNMALAPVAYAPQNGAKDLPLTTAMAQVTFDAEVDPATVNEANITITPAVPTYELQLSPDKKTVSLLFGTGLLAGTAYTVQFSDKVVGLAAQNPIDSNKRSYSFSTIASADVLTDELDGLAVGTNGVVQVSEGFSKNWNAPEAWDGDTCRVCAGGMADGQVKYITWSQPQGIRSFLAKTFELDGRGDNAQIAFESSVDGVEFIPVDAARVSTGVAPAGGDNFGMYDYNVSALPGGTKYVRVAFSGASGWVWSKYLRSMTLNHMGGAGAIELVSSMPQQGAADVLPGKLITLEFNQTLYEAGISKEQFSVSDGTPVEEAILLADNKTVAVVLAEPLEADTDYTVYYDGIQDLYGTAGAGSITFTTGSANAPYVKDAYLTKDGLRTTDVDGTPVFVIENPTGAEQQAAVITAAYDGNKLVSAEAEDVTLTAGTNRVEQEPLKDGGMAVKQFVWDGFTAMAPLSKRQAVEEQPSDNPTVYLVGDSICADYGTYGWYPQQGWGHYLEDLFDGSVTVENRAVQGKSTKTFIQEGLWKGITDVLQPGDYVFVSMGHNDKMLYNPAVGTEIPVYKQYLQQYIDETRALGANIVFVTSIPEAWEDDFSNSLAERAAVMAEVALANGVTVLDLNTAFYTHLQTMGLDAARRAYYMDYNTIAEKYPSEIGHHYNGNIKNGTSDYTHITEAGALKVAETVAELLRKSQSPLKNMLKNQGVFVDTEFYPGYVRKAVVFSYDDGFAEDERIIGILNEHGLKGTFNLLYPRVTDETQSTYLHGEQAKEVYQGQEVASHTLTHPNLGGLSFEEASAELLDNQRGLAEFFGTEVTGFAFPYANPWKDDITNLLKKTHSYARNADTDNGNMDVSAIDLYAWRFTCHHDNLNNYKDAFFNMEDDGTLKLLSVWGHGEDFTKNGNWSILEEFAAEVGARKAEIWNPTAAEFAEYVKAQRNMQVLKHMVYNPSEDTAVYVRINGAGAVLEPGETIFY